MCAHHLEMALPKSLLARDAHQCKARRHCIARFTLWNVPALLNVHIIGVIFAKPVYGCLWVILTYIHTSLR